MASLRDIRDRIQSVKNTRQITRAMKLVAGAKLKRATDAAMAAKPYQETLQRVLGRVVESAGDVEHPLLKVPEGNDTVLVLLMTSDRGLCGGFNASLCRFVKAEIDTLSAAGKTVELHCYGRKGRDFFSARDYPIAKAVTPIEPRDYEALSDQLAIQLAHGLAHGAFGQAIVASNKFVSVMNQEPTFAQALPMSIEGGSGAKGEDTALATTGGSGEYIYEPAGPQILGTLLPMALKTQIFQAFLESQAGEQASRMTAMDAATRNAGELIDGLKLTYNRARQAAITKELIEIVSGAEAL